MDGTLSDVLGRYVTRAHTSLSRLARLSGIPKQTLANWLEGRIRRPRRWLDLVKVATALHLTEAEADDLLRAAGQRPLAELRTAAPPAEQAIFQPWPPRAAASVPRPSSPFQAIATPPFFVGREAELAYLRELLLNGGRSTVCGLRGMGGVGKTALAARLAHQLRNEFSDGVLWARLDASDTLAILGQFADAYGKDVSGHRDLGARAAVVRDLLKDKRCLIVLDNVDSSRQLHDLPLPALGRSAVLVTTRADLAALDGWPTLTLAPFSDHSDEALQLFERRLGPAYVQARRAALCEIADRLGHLPLALAIAAGQLAAGAPPGRAAAAGPDTRLEALRQALRSAATRLEALARDDQAVRVSFDLSFSRLPPEHQAFWAALGVFGGEDFGLEAAAAVTETAPEFAAACLKALYGRSLAQAGRADRWHLHPLLRDYAREKLGPRYPAGVGRALRFYTSEAERLNGAGLQPLLPELGNLLAALQAAAELALSQALAHTLTAWQPALQALGLYPVLDAYAEQALEGARAAGDPKLLARLLLRLMVFEMDGRNDYARASALGQEAARLAEAAAAWPLAVDALAQLARAAQQVRDAEAEDHYAAHAEHLARRHHLYETTSRLIHDRAFRLLLRGQPDQAEAELRVFLEQARLDQAELWIQTALESLGYLLHYRGRFAEAEACYQESLATADRLGQARPAFLLSEIAENLTAQGRLAEAWASAAEGVALARQSGSARLLMMCLINAGDVQLAAGQTGPAEALWREAFALAQASRLAPMRGVLLGRLGLAALARGDEPAAAAALEPVLALVEHSGPAAQGFARYWLARLAAVQKNAAAARIHGQAAAELFASIGYWRAAEVRDWLAALG